MRGCGGDTGRPTTELYLLLIADFGTGKSGDARGAAVLLEASVSSTNFAL